jgi:hypothetical protein
MEDKVILIARDLVGGTGVCNKRKWTICSGGVIDGRQSDIDSKGFGWRDKSLQ